MCSTNNRTKVRMCSTNNRTKVRVCSTNNRTKVRVCSTNNRIKVSTNGHKLGRCLSQMLRSSFLVTECGCFHYKAFEQMGSLLFPTRCCCRPTALTSFLGFYWLLRRTAPTCYLPFTMCPPPLPNIYIRAPVEILELYQRRK